MIHIRLGCGEDLASRAGVEGASDVLDVCVSLLWLGEGGRAARATPREGLVTSDLM